MDDAHTSCCLISSSAYILVLRLISGIGTLRDKIISQVQESKEHRGVASKSDIRRILLRWFSPKKYRQSLELVRQMMLFLQCG